MGRTVLLTGRPGVGKTTLIQKWVASRPGRCGGFYTQELRESGTRVGFEIVTLDGKRALLAHVRRPGPPRVGKYGGGLARLASASTACTWTTCRPSPCQRSSAL